jgi:hypothetical protein
MQPPRETSGSAGPSTRLASPTPESGPAGPRPPADRIGAQCEHLSRRPEEFIETLQRIAKGESVVDPALLAELVAARRRDDPLAVLSESARC